MNFEVKLRSIERSTISVVSMFTPVLWFDDLCVPHLISEGSSPWHVVELICYAREKRII